ncbi:MAG: hypothetical protein AAB152_10145 [Candidatus Coatesbacteria bacterium]
MTFRAGAVQTAVFMNPRKVDGKKVEIPSVSFQKRYRDGEEWKSTSSLDTNDLPKAILALSKAYDYVLGLPRQTGEEEVSDNDTEPGTE